MTLEMLNIYDEDGTPLGTASRQEAHQKGLLHDVVHCWIVDPSGGGRIFFQQRAHDKETFPNYFDIAVGGHISAGEPPITAVLREINEEVGLSLHEEELISIGNVRKADYFSEGLDREIGRVFLHLCHEPKFNTGAEVAQMVSITVPEFLSRFDKPEISARSMSGAEIKIPLSAWAGAPSREFEDHILPRLDSVYFNVTNLCDDFSLLCDALDEELNVIAGGLEKRAEHTPHNVMESAEAVVMMYKQGEPIGCAAIRERDGVPEVKRVYIRPDYRGSGYSKPLMQLLENCARQLGYDYIILETGAMLPTAISLYKRIGYEIIDKYPPYLDMEDAICMGKAL